MNLSLLNTLNGIAGNSELPTDVRELAAKRLRELLAEPVPTEEPELDPLTIAAQEGFRKAIEG